MSGASLPLSPRPRPGNRRGPDKRQRSLTRAARLTAAEAAQFDAKAATAGISVGALIRHAVLDLQLPPRRQRRARVDLQPVAALLQTAGELSAELGKQGSNLNQLAYQANANRVPPGFVPQLEQALAAIDAGQGALIQLADACMKILGFDAANDD